MEQEMLKYLSKYATLTPELEKAIVESAFIQTFEKGTVLLKEGERSNRCFFVLKGCVRSYSLKDGEEQTIEFYTEEQVVSPPTYGMDIPSSQHVECVETVIAGVGTPQSEEETYTKYPEIESLSRVIAEAIMAKHQADFADFKMATPEERYLNLLRTRPELIQRVPQYQIASYLGMKPESLSRIRKRMTENQRS